VRSLFRMLEILGIPSKLSAYGVTKEDIPRFTASTMTITRLFFWNPRNLTEEDIKAIYHQAL